MLQVRNTSIPSCTFCDASKKKKIESQVPCTYTTVPQWLDAYVCYVMLQSAFKEKKNFGRKRGVSHTSYDILKDVCTCLFLFLGKKIFFGRKQGVSHTSYDIFKDVCTCLLHTMLRSQGKLFLQGREASRTLPTIS